ncbi:smalltalk protein [Hallella sp.]
MKLSRQTWKNIVQLALSILTALATTLGLNSCL